jgi:phenylalanyl-tRNA synthetase alpha chain
MQKNIVIKNKEEDVLLAELNQRNDIKAERIKRLLALQELTKKENSPVKIIADQIINLPRFAEFDLVDFPRIVTVEQCFDLLNAPLDHPSRGESDTYFINEKYLLRTQTTVMWSFYLRNPEILEKLEKDGQVGELSCGTVFRKDEIDRKHFPAFHQIDGLYVCRKDKQIITQKDLEEIEAEIVKTIFGPNIEFRFLVDSFPFTDPSVQIEI